MNIERLRKSHKKQIAIGAVAICIVRGALTFNLTKAKYKLTESIPLVRGTVNYKVPDLRTVALYTANDSGVYQETNDIPTSGYTLNKTKSVCKVYDGSTSVENAPIDNSITIEYKSGKVNFLGISKRNTRCYLYFDRKDTDTVTVPFGEIEVKRTTPDFSKVAITDEGIYQVSDGMYGGTSYYWRGAVTNNYVTFAGFCWRIVRINGDKSMRLIYDGATCHANGTSTTDSIAIANQVYSRSHNQSEYVGWTYSTGSQRTLGGTASNAKSQTDTWYSNNIGNNTTYASKIANGKYCNDRNTASGYSWSSQPSSMLYYAGYDRNGAKSSSSVTPTLSCLSGDVYTLKAGAITMDEVIIAGGKWETANNSYYLYNGQEYWTMSPYRLYFVVSSYARMHIVLNDGRLVDRNVSNAWGLRPVINLRSDVLFSGGNGTQSSPYVVQ